MKNREHAKRWNLRGVGILLALVASSAGGVLPAWAAQPSESVLQSSIDKSVDTLLLVKDDRTLSSEERETQELALRRKIVREAIELSKREVVSVRERLESARTESDRLDTRRLRLEKELAAWEAYYAERLRAVETALTVGEVKKIAQAIQEARNEEQSSLVRSAFNLILVGQLSELVETAETRSEKIAVDLKKLERANVIKPGYFKKEAHEAARFIEAAKKLKNQAVNRLTDEEKAFAAGEDEREAKTADPITKDPEATETPVIGSNEAREAEERIEVQPTTRELVEAAVVNLKSGYDAFLRISYAVKKILH